MEYVEVRFSKATAVSPNGIAVVRYAAGAVGSLPQHLAQEVVDAGWASLFVEDFPITDEDGVPFPPTLEMVIKAGYTSEAAAGIVAEEERKFNAGEKPYGDKDPSEDEKDEDGDEGEDEDGKDESDPSQSKAEGNPTQSKKEKGKGKYKR